MKGSLAIVEELEDISQSDIINNIIIYAVILLLHLIKQQAENRSTRSWEVSIPNSVLKIQGLNKRRKAGGVYLPPEELRLSLEEAYQQAINEASLEVEAGQYKAKELEQLVNREQILDLALNLILR
ncbi:MULTISPECIES: DUF29 family protein [Kamptonema]|uniref:DUF29 family protein n=1 Tax=Kamptonema TaxID=1501433 RepID=UPI0008FC19C2|nr:MULTISPECIES: DUF29 family protein [Kamptonema]